MGHTDKRDSLPTSQGGRLESKECLQAQIHVDEELHVVWHPLWVGTILSMIQFSFCCVLLY